MDEYLNKLQLTDDNTRLIAENVALRAYVATLEAQLHAANTALQKAYSNAVCGAGAIEDYIEIRKEQAK